MKTITILALYALNVAVLNAGGECEKILLDKRGETITAVQSNSVGLIDIYDTMIIEMDINIGTLDVSATEVWESVFHIGRTNSERWPGIWLHTTAGSEGAYDGFTLAYGDNVNWNTHQEQTAAGGAFTDNMMISYKSIQTQDHLLIIENGVTLYNKSYLGHPTTTTGDVNVYIGDPWYEAADVSITNLVISTITECDCSAVDIDGYLTQCSDAFDEAETNIGDLRADVDTNTNDISSIKDDIEDIQNTLALIANLNSYGSQSATLFDLDINHQNYLLLFSLIVNVVLGLLAYCMYNTIKSKKEYSKVKSYVDSDN